MSKGTLTTQVNSYVRRILEYFKERPSSIPLAIFMVSLIVSALIYLSNPWLANEIMIYMFWFLVIGIVWRIIEVSGIHLTVRPEKRRSKK